ncbi:MAG: C4-dicarboxylate ABC transporter [Deinococcus-Thermus bacterium]|jgi:TRAP-type C4-dicarboxylate transport system substrate-binding protein|nr:C4-dicarboxylate ABC transporter [Deinococcota bacterium]
MTKPWSTAALTAGAGALALGIAGAPAAAQEIELTLSHFLPPVHGIHTDFIEPWARELEARTDGRVAVEIFPGTAALGNVAQQYDQVVAGVTDIAHGLAGIPRGRFPRTSIMDLPFLTDDAGVASQTLWTLYQEMIGDEYAEVKVLALHCHNGGLIHTRETPVETMEDMAGLRIRTPSPAISSMLEFLGATPVGLPPGQVYENLQRGAIDGSVFPWDPVASFRLAEVLDHHLAAGAYTTCFFFVMNQGTYDDLPEAVRAEIDAMSGESLVAQFGDWWDAWDAPGLEAAEARGNAISFLTDAERERWRAALDPMIEDWLDAMEADGIDDARAIYARAQELVAEHSGE